MSDATAVTRLNEALEGRYRIERELGEGGMATVYLADDLKHERKVALKVLRPELAAVLGAERFLTEIKTTANLQHPHILPLFDSGTADGYVYYVMPFIDGQTLRAKLDREKQLGVDEAVRIARDVADALDYAHRAGVIHRDIKPENVLLHDGRPVVADFGIALAVSAAGGGRMTETGLSLGTPHYMSPEQASADRDLTARSDVYSLGCMLYEMLGGQPPHTGPSAQSILVHILTKEPTPLTELRHTVPPHVAATVAKSIEKLPADRFETARRFTEALGDESFRYRAKPHPVAAPEPSADLAASARPWLKDYRSVAALVFALGMTAVAVSALFSGGPEPRSQPAPSTRSVLSLGAIEPGPEDDILVSPDGSRFAVAGRIEGEGDERALFWRNAADETFRVLPGTEGAGDGAAFSPDGNWLVYVVGELNQDDGLFKASLLGGAPTPVVPPGLSNPRDPSWGDDGTIVFVSDAGLHRVPDTGGEPLLFGEPGLTTPSILPGGGGVLAGRGGGGVMWVDPESDSIRELLPGGFDPKYVETGHVLYVDEAGGLWAFAFDVDRSEVAGAPVPILDGLSVYGRGPDRRYARLSVSRNGTLAYTAGAGFLATGNIFAPVEFAVFDLDGNEERLPLTPRPVSAVGWSPDGRSIVYSSGIAGEDAQIYTYDTELGTTPRQLTFEGDNAGPVYSPDGARVAFSSLREGTDGYDLFVDDLDDGLPPRSIVALEADQIASQWPSDSLIVFETRADGNSDLWTVDLSDPENPSVQEYLSSEFDLRYMIVSPDGTLAAYSSNESGQREVYIRSFPDPGGLTIVSEGGGSVPFWSSDGSTLFYHLLGRPFTAVRIERDPVPVVVSREETFSPTGLAVRPFQGSALHPDGDRFVLGVLASSDAAAPGSERFVLVTNWFDELCARMGGC